MAKKKLVRVSPTKSPGNPCTCGKVSVEKEDDKAVIRGPGFVTENQFVNCGHCRWKIRYAPQPVWETPSGERYSTRGYLKSGESRKL